MGKTFKRDLIEALYDSKTVRNTSYVGKFVMGKLSSHTYPSTWIPNECMVMRIDVVEYPMDGVD